MQALQQEQVNERNELYFWFLLRERSYGRVVDVGRVCTSIDFYANDVAEKPWKLTAVIEFAAASRLPFELGLLGKKKLLFFFLF